MKIKIKPYIISYMYAYRCIYVCRSLWLTDEHNM